METPKAKTEEQVLDNKIENSNCNWRRDCIKLYTLL